MQSNIFKKMAIVITLIAAASFGVMGIVLIKNAPNQANIISTYRASKQCAATVPSSENCFYINPAKVLSFGTVVDSKHFAHLMVEFQNLNNNLHYSVEFLHTPLFDQLKVGQIIYVKIWQGKVTAAFDNPDLKSGKNLITPANPQVEEHLELDGGLALISFGVILLLLIVPHKKAVKAVAYL